MTGWVTTKRWWSNSGNYLRANLTPEQRKTVKAFATAIKALRKRK